MNIPTCTAVSNPRLSLTFPENATMSPPPERKAPLTKGYGFGVDGAATYVSSVHYFDFDDGDRMADIGGTFDGLYETEAEAQRNADEVQAGFDRLS